MTLQMKQDTGGTVTLQAATSGTATATVPAIAGVVSVELKGADIASATTTDLSTATGDFVDVTGTTTITGLGTLAAGIERTVRFTGALTLTHNATSLILPGAANITTAANDRAIFRSLGSGNWICISYNKASGAAVVSSGGGLTNFTESTATYSTKVYVALVPNNAATNVNTVFSAKGTGYISAQIPDGTTTGGNQRGPKSVDLQMTRSAASQIVGGYYSFAAGSNNTVSGNSSGSIGKGNTCSGNYSMAFGKDNSSTHGGIAAGIACASTSSYSASIGGRNTADGKYGFACGYTATARGLAGCFAFASGNYDADSSARGRPQVCTYILYRKTTDGTANQSLIGNFCATSTAGTTNQVVLPNNSTYTFRAEVVAHRTDVLSGLTNRSSWVVQGVAYRDGSAATTGVSSTVTVISNTPGYTLTVDADTTNGALRFKVTGTAGHTVLWLARVNTSEVKS